MKLFILFIVPIISFADCSFKDDIKKNQDGTYTYSRDCHVEVGRDLEELDIRKEQNEVYKKIVTLKDLQIEDYQKRSDLWKNTSVDLSDRLSKIENTRNTDKILYFGLGIATMVLSAYTASKIMK